MRFLLVDRILDLVPGESAQGLKNVAMSEDYLAFHFPENPIMPGALITESLSQLAEWLIRASTDFRQVGWVTACERARFHRMVRPGDQLTLSVKVLERDEESWRFKGEARRDGQRAASGRFVMALVDAEELEDPAAARRFYERLTFREEGKKGLLGA